jgi:uncharacterized cupin superfamily protein
MNTKPSKKHAFQIDAIPPSTGTGYPAPFTWVADGRGKYAAGDHAGLNQYGVNIVTLPPGAASAQRHWHEKEDEFVYILTGELTLITDDGEEIVSPGMMMGFPAACQNGHHLINRSDSHATYMEIGTRSDDETCHYPDIDLLYNSKNTEHPFSHKDGTPYEE